MKQLVLNVADHKLQTFLSFIEDLNYVEVVEKPLDEPTALTPNEEALPPDDFMALAGIWEDRDISAEDLRAKAWPTHK